MIDKAFFDRPVAIVAADLIGCELHVNSAGGIIVETEAYDQADPASHSFGGPRGRNLTMYGPPGHAYVYRSYGIHWCMNFVCEREGFGAGILIRALRPTLGLDAMAERRGLTDPLKLCSGPGRLAQALDIDRSFDGLPLDAPPFRLEARSDVPTVAIGPRIGLSKGVVTLWRFGLAGSPYLSRRFREGPAGS